jgi:type II restriction/modification system DNA methylase subunit YeeA
MIQAVVNPALRENLGMHYTSVPNIMKVIQPLFLDELWAEFMACEGSKKKLLALKERIARIRIFDPACGSGNFLIISYKELCRLEAEILKELNPGRQTGFDFTYDESLSTIRLSNFYGIEIDDFASEVAKLSLYLAQHQVNMMFERTFGKLKPILPLKESGNILKENATRVAWDKFCPRKDDSKNEYETYLVGNPPYLGSRNQDQEQKDDLAFVFGKDYKSLDYISAWFYKGAQYMAGYEKVKLAFVSTNSIAQGEQVVLLWPRIFDMGGEIFFAHQSFKWQNNARHNAGVTVVIIGLSPKSENEKNLYVENKKISVENISPYLTGSPTVFVESRSIPLSKFPKMNFGNMPADNGKLLFTKGEMTDFTKKNPGTEKFFKKLISADEFLNGKTRYCLWLKDYDLNELNKIDSIKKVIDELRVIREKSSRPKLASIPQLFAQITQPENRSYILVPRHSSETREYIPLGFFDKNEVAHDSCLIVPTEDLFLYGVLHSRMHMVWVRAVGGKLKTDYRYSKNVVYNTFPFPAITEEQKKIITHQVHNILDEREKHSEKTMAELYDPEKMPDGLRDAHYLLDEVIDKIYRQKPFENDEERLAHLFTLYESMIRKEDEQKSLKPKGKK